MLIQQSASSSMITDGHQQVHPTCFGVVSNSYAAGRKGYVEEVYTIIQKYLPQSSLVVDICSGTGISTRELYEHGFFRVIGVDNDQQMIDEALKTNEYSIPYFLFELREGLNNQPDMLKEGVDGISVFTGFHWFCDSDAAIEGIFKTLKDEGYFIIVGGFGFRRGRGDGIQAEIEKAIAVEIGHPLPEKTIHLEKALEGHFKIIEDSKTAPHKETYTPEEYLALMKSRNYWPDHVGNREFEERIEKKIIEIINRRKDEEGLIRIERSTRVVVAQKI